MTESAKIIKIVVGVSAGVIILLAILLSSSYSDVEYYEYGFLKRKSTGTVYTDKVYGMGHHLVGPDYKFKKFLADAHFVNLTGVPIFTSDKLEVWLSAKYQYFLRKQELALLHRDYDVYYDDIIRRNALDALKAATTAYTPDEMIEKRAVVEAALFKVVRERLGGICCEHDCEEDESCAAGCRPQSECQDTDRGLYVSVRYFHLLNLQLPSNLAAKKIRAITLSDETETAALQQEIAIIQKQTDVILEKTKNEVLEIQQNVTVYSEYILAQANANATAMIERSRSEGLRSLYKRLGLSNEDHRNSFDYLRTIKGMDNAHLSVDYNQLITGNF